MSVAIAINTWMQESGTSLGRRSGRLRTLDKMNDKLIHEVLRARTFSH